MTALARRLDDVDRPYVPRVAQRDPVEQLDHAPLAQIAGAPAGGRRPRAADVILTKQQYLE